VDFATAERRYRELKGLYDAGQLSAKDFQAEVDKLMLQDEEKRWWMIGISSGKWYVNKEGQWIEAQPPSPVPAEGPLPKEEVKTIPMPVPPLAQPAARLPPRIRERETVPSSRAPAPPAQQTYRAAPVSYTPPSPPPTGLLALSGWLLGVALGGLAVVVLVVAVVVAYIIGRPHPTPQSSPTAAAQATQPPTPTTPVGSIVTTPPSPPTPGERLSAPTSTPVVVEPTATPTVPPIEVTSPEVTTGVDTATPTPTPSPSPKAPTRTPRPKPAAISGKLAFSLRQGELFKVYVVRLPDKTYIAGIDNARQPDLGPDGGLLAVNGTGGGQEKLLIMSPEGKAPKEASCYTTSAHPFFSPDGSWLVFDDPMVDPKGGRIYVQKLAEAPNCNIRSLSAVGTALSEIVGGPGSYMFPLWSADNRIIFRGCDTWTGSGTHCGLWAINPDGSNPVQVTDNPNYIPTDTAKDMVAFMSAESGNWEIYIQSLKGGEPRNLTNNPANDGLATFSPDASRIAFLSNREGRWAVWVMSVGGGEAEKLLDFNPDMGAVDQAIWTEERLSWSP
jgi:hypothetical protein